jgi:hypothetical protein
LFHDKRKQRIKLKQYLVFAILISAFSLNLLISQTLSSRVYVQTNYHMRFVFPFRSDAVLIYNANSQELSFFIDFATFKVGVDSLMSG